MAGRNTGGYDGQYRAWLGCLDAGDGPELAGLWSPRRIRPWIWNQVARFERAW